MRICTIRTPALTAFYQGSSPSTGYRIKDPPAPIYLFGLCRQPSSTLHAAQERINGSRPKVVTMSDKFLNHPHAENCPKRCMVQDMQADQSDVQFLKIGSARHQ